MTKDIENLEHAFTVDNEFTVADEGEVVAVVVAHSEHQLEALGIICGLGLEAVARVGEEVGLSAGEVVDQIEN